MPDSMLTSQDRVTRRRFIGCAAAATAWRALRVSAADPAAARLDVDADDRRKIEAAIPGAACAAPRRARRLLVFHLNVGYPGHVARFPGGVYPGHVKDSGHRSIAHANLAFELMGRKTGAFEAVISRDPALFAPDTLRQFDAVLFNSTVGNLFEDPVLRRSLVEFVRGGGGMLGIHGASVAFTRWPGAVEDWPEFGLMLGARGAAHMPGNGGEQVTIKLDDVDHPLNRPFAGRAFDCRGEFFRFHDPYSRNRVRVLSSIDNAATARLQGAPLKQFRDDGDYAVAWVRNCGKGRVFYCSIGHDARVFWDPTMLEFYLGAAQFALGDLHCPTVPSGRLTPALRAQENLGWRVGLDGDARTTLFDAIDRAGALALPFLGASDSASVSAGIPAPFNPNLSDDDLRRVRLKLDEAGVRLLTYSAGAIPGDPTACRRLFEFARGLGIETLIAAPAPDALGAIGRFCDEFDISLALRADGNPKCYSRPEDVVGACRGLTRRVGVCATPERWLRAGIDPVRALRTLADRLITVRIGDTHPSAGAERVVPGKTAPGASAVFLRELDRLDLKPAMIGLECTRDTPGAPSSIARRIESINRLSIELDRTHPS